MAKALIIGVNARQFKDKKTQEMRNMLTLSVAKNNCNYDGKAVEEVVVTDNQPLYGVILSYVKGSIPSLLFQFVSIDRDQRGYIEGFEFLNKDEKAVVWGF